MMHRPATEYNQRARVIFVSVLLVLGALVLAWRAVDLHLVRKGFLQTQGDARTLRVVPVPAHRGTITDRNGEPLAISTPVESVWANPQEVISARASWPKLARVLDMEPSHLKQLLIGRQGKEFVYLRRHITPELAERVMALEIPGVALQQEYRRYYPAGEVAAHAVGLTNVDDFGQEGIELAYDEQLRGIPGAKRVIRDSLGRIVEDVESVREPRPGQDLALSLDRRIQYVAYRELLAAVRKHQAASGSAVVVDVTTGEVLAMVNQPSYNPNSRVRISSARVRNRAVTDVFEPGSSIKPFTVAAALETGKFRPESIIDTRPGQMRVGTKTIHDFRDYGLINLTTLLQKSSNIGASKLALAIPPEKLWEMFAGVGFGIDTGSGFPGETAGLLTSFGRWGDIQRATLSFGYGLSVTPLQLARAYVMLAGDGRLRPLSLVRRASQLEPLFGGKPIISEPVLKQVRHMMEAVVLEGGTGTSAAVTGYRISGKTGTSKKSDVGGYAEDSFISVFAGMAPASKPRLVMIVTIHDPRGEAYYGGDVAAPVFARVMSDALRILDIPPDNLPTATRLAQLGPVR